MTDSLIETMPDSADSDINERKKSKKQALWFWVHGWLSLPIWVFFCLICVTGTVAVISHELTWLTNPAARAANPQNLPPKPLAELVQVVQQRVPAADIQGIYVLEPYLVTVVNYATSEQPAVMAYVNPYTAEIQAHETGITFIGFMRSLHGWLLAPWHAANGGYFSWGYYGVCLLSVLILGAVATGLVIYKKFWRAVTRPRIRWRSNSRTMFGDLHRHGGVWSLWFLLVIGLTALFYLVQAVFWHVGEGERLSPHPAPLLVQQVPVAANGATPAMISFAQAEQAARKALPEVRWAWISVPEHNRDYFQFAGEGNGVFYDNSSYKVYINPWTGEASQIETPQGMSVLQRLSHIVDPLHYGTLAGWVTKVIWLLFGLVLMAMSITGFVVWWQRTAKEVRKERINWSIAQKVGFRGKYLLNSLLLVLPVWFLYESLTPEFPAAWPQQTIGQLTVTPTPADNLPPYEGESSLVKDFSVQFCQDCTAKIRLAWMNIGDTPLAQAPNEYGVVHGSRYGQHVHVPYTSPQTASNRLWLSVQTWDGQVHRQSWDVSGR